MDEISLIMLIVFVSIFAIVQTVRIADLNFFIYSYLTLDKKDVEKYKAIFKKEKKQEAQKLYENYGSCYTCYFGDDLGRNIAVHTTRCGNKDCEHYGEEITDSIDVGCTSGYCPGAIPSTLETRFKDLRS